MKKHKQQNIGAKSDEASRVKSEKRKKEIVELAIDVLEDTENAIRWLNSPVISLGGRRPIEIWGTEAGSKQVTNVLYCIEYGIL